MSECADDVLADDVLADGVLADGVLAGDVLRDHKEFVAMVDADCDVGANAAIDVSVG